MAARNQFSEFEELSWLRRRVAELERATTEKTRAGSVASEGREVLENLVSRIPGLVWVDDELGRMVTRNAACGDFAERNGTAALAELRSDAASTPHDHGFQVTRFGFRTTSGKYYSAGIAMPPEAGIAGLASRPLFQSDLIGILECRGNRIVDASDSILGWLGHQRNALTEPGLDSA